MIWIRERCVICGACVQVCPTVARDFVGRDMTAEQVMKEIEKDRAFYEDSGGGVTFSGGEPLLQALFLLQLAKLCKERDIHSALDTSGQAVWLIFESLLPFIDLYLYDLKFMDDERHRLSTGVSNRMILQNLEKLAKERARVIVRLPVVPGINDDNENISRIGKYVGKLKNIQAIDLLPYHATGAGKYVIKQDPYELAQIQAPTEQRLDEIIHLLKKYDVPVTLRGQQQ